MSIRQIIEPVHFRNLRHPGLAVEGMTLSELRSRVPRRHLVQSSRPEFHQLILVTRGEFTHVVDFVEYRCKAGDVLHVRPGQVQQLVLQARAEGAVLLFAREFLPAQEAVGAGFPAGMTLLEAAVPQAVLCAGEESRGPLEASFRLLIEEYQRADGRALSAAVMRHQLVALLLMLARVSMGDHAHFQPGAAAARVYLRFTRALEAHFVQSHSVDFYARRLGVSAKTLVRSCRAAVGRAPKDVIAQRVLLEAKRMLAHSNASVATIASDVGFSEATNFVKFFRRGTGRSPGAFRQESTDAA